MNDPWLTIHNKNTKITDFSDPDPIDPDPQHGLF